MTLTFKIQIRNIMKPPVWRRVEIPANLTFEDFHLTIQRAFGWGNYHLYQFQKHPYDQGWLINVPSENDAGGGLFGSEDEAMDSRETLVSDFISRMGLKKFVYVYDFGDDWIHDVTLEKTDNSTTLLHPICRAGKGACPPEDCGGPWGYENIKQLFAEKPKSEDAKMYLEWMELEDANEFDPNDFNLTSVNIQLGTISASKPRLKPVKSPPRKNPEHFVNPMEEFLRFLSDTSYLEGWEEDDFEDDDDLDDYEDCLEDIEGIYDLSETASRYEIRIEPSGKYSETALTLQVPSNMTLNGFARLIAVAFGEKKPELYEFVDQEGFRFLSDEREHAQDKDYWQMDSTEFCPISMLLYKKTETADFIVRKSKKKVLARYSLCLEKKGRYTAKTIHRIDLLKANGLATAEIDEARQRLYDFEEENEVATEKEKP